MIAIGQHLYCRVSCAGLNFSFQEGDLIPVTRDNIDDMESLYRAGHIVSSEPVRLDEVMSEIERGGALELNTKLEFVRLKQQPKDISIRRRVLCFVAFDRLELDVLRAITSQRNAPSFDLWLACDNPYSSQNGGAYKNIQMNYEKMRQVALKENYDAVWVVESDTVPPNDALAKLLEVDASVVSGLYALRHGDPVPNLYHPGKGLSSMSWSDIKTLWGKTIPIGGGCMGCLLIRRDALLNFPFESEDYQRVAPDGAFMRYCSEHGIKQMARLDVVCKHIKVNGEVLVPDKNAGWRREGRNVI